jgi:hypothetical protein
VTKKYLKKQQIKGYLRVIATKTGYTLKYLKTGADEAN